MEPAYAAIYVTGLPKLMTGTQLADLCADYGAVTEAWIERDPLTGSAWPLGYVCFASADEARRAADALHGLRYRGDILAARQIGRAPEPPKEVAAARAGGTLGRPSPCAPAAGRSGEESDGTADAR